MKHIVIGTAGHIDHGKSCLTTALTEDSASRRHIDRLKEERQQSVLRPAEFVGLQDAEARAVEVVCRVGKCYLFHLVHVGTDETAVGELHEHGGGLLSREMCSSQKGSSQ